MILTPSQKLPNNVGDVGKIIVATSFEWLPKGQKFAKSGHTALPETQKVSVQLACLWGIILPWFFIEATMVKYNWLVLVYHAMTIYF